MIKIYNSLTNKLETFTTIHDNEVSMYVCGSTVYDNMHIGNSRPVIFFDTVARFFKFLGYNVKLVSNYTDIDDKIIKKAEEEGLGEDEIAKRYINSILETYRKLNCLPHYRNPQVTGVIPEIINFIQLLIGKNGAYISDGDVYFAIDSVSDYGILSGQSKDKLYAGARIEENEKKRNPGDFNLWKKTTKGLQFASPWSMGRPGWHTECVVMIDSIFHGPIDIHGGGLDLKFPHHENEIAQAKVAYAHNIAKIWMHNGLIDLAGEKMSKSLGNIIQANELVEKIGYQVYRLLILNVPYRQPLNYKEDLITQAQNDLEKMMRPYIGLQRKLQIDYHEIADAKEITLEELIALRLEFISAMSDDFNTANAITTIHKVAKLMNSLLRQDFDDVKKIKETLYLFTQITDVLGLHKPLSPLSEEQIHLVKKWREARAEKDFAVADKYRDEVMKMGVLF